MLDQQRCLINMHSCYQWQDHSRLPRTVLVLPVGATPEHAAQPNTTAAAPAAVAFAGAAKLNVWVQPRVAAALQARLLWSAAARCATHLRLCKLHKHLCSRVCHSHFVEDSGTIVGDDHLTISCSNLQDSTANVQIVPTSSP